VEYEDTYIEEYEDTYSSIYRRIGTPETSQRRKIKKRERKKEKKVTDNFLRGLVKFMNFLVKLHEVRRVSRTSIQET
jgi:hypothetical protein